MVGWNTRAWVMAVVLGAAIGCTKDDGSGEAGSSAGSGAVSGSGGAGTSGAGAGGSGTGGSGGGTPAPSCERTEQCDDGLFCNGDEVCEDGRCAPGTVPECDDGIDCTVDGCDESRNACDSTAPDGDRDGHSDATCLDHDEQPLGDDCDDSDSTRYPGALEVCDADDHDEDCDLNTFGRVDADGDGYLNANCCNVQLDGNPFCGNDCDDASGRIHPFNTEACDGLDNDCNGQLDHPLEDQDGDGHAASACGGTDCDDFDPMTYAGAMERCDGSDNDCIQGGGPAADELDEDSDTFVSGVCMRMTESDLSSGDCDDARPSANAMEPELCNGRDDDCDGRIDETLSCDAAIKHVDANEWQTCAVRVNGTVACWGWNYGGILGTGADAWWLSYPRNVLDPTDPTLQLRYATQVSVGAIHSCALRSDGRVSCWGENGDEGRLGAGSVEAGVQAPVTVSGLEDAAEVCTAVNQSCARTGSGEVWCWGYNYNGTFPDDDAEVNAVPKRVAGLESVVDIDCNAFFACAVIADGSVRCWGDNRNGQLGDITTDPRHTHDEVYGVENAIQVVTSRSHACALQRGGTVMCWGDNEYGQVGTGTSSGNVLRATQALLYTGIPLKGAVEITAGGGQPYSDSSLDPSGFTCARMRNGEVVCWGRNQVGQLGYGAWDDNGRVAPAMLDSARYPVQELPDAILISGGHQHACAIAPDGTLRCWGGGEGQLPDDDIWTALSPLLIEGL